MTELTEKQRLFVDAYVGPSRGDAADAARRAGYAGDAATLERTGRRNLENRFVRDAIDRASKGSVRKPARSIAKAVGTVQGRVRGLRRALLEKLREKSSPRRNRILALGNPRLRLAKKLQRAR